MSPTSLVPGASAWKSRASRSGIMPGSPATVVVGRNGRGWQGIRPSSRMIERTSSGGEALALAVQGGMDPAVPVGVVGVVEDPLDEGGQAGPTPGGRRGGPVAPLVEARGRHVHPRAHLHDRVPRLLGIDERELHAHRYSWAKKAAAFPKNSAFIFSSRFSRSSSRSRARSEIDSGGSSPTWSSRYLCTQLPRVPSFT